MFLTIMILAILGIFGLVILQDKILDILMSVVGLIYVSLDNVFNLIFNK